MNQQQNAKVAIAVKSCLDHRPKGEEKSQRKLHKWWLRAAKHWHRHETCLPQQALPDPSASHRAPFGKPAVAFTFYNYFHP